MQKILQFIICFAALACAAAVPAGAATAFELYEQRPADIQNYRTQHPHFWRDCDLSALDFYELLNIYKLGIISENQYANAIMYASRNEDLCRAIYSGRIIDLKRDLILSEKTIRDALNKNQLRVFYANLLYTIPASERIGELDEYLRNEHFRHNRPQNLLTLIFGGG
ncbi:MAG: hypothetical protein IKO42_07110 [Opitutales bacterium]|nr:hypothetical protein [Opitutales bacterium]